MTEFGSVLATRTSPPTSKKQRTRAC